MNRKYLIVLSLLLIEFLALSENVRYKFSYYGKNEGLSQFFITCMEQDDRGFIWIGTGEGLYKFDGINFVRYDSDNHLSYNFVSACVEDSLGRLWFGHSGGGVTINDHGKFTSLKTNKEVPISDMFVNGGDVWLASQRNGFTTVNRFNQMNELDSPLPNRSILSTKPIGYDRYLFGTNQGLFIAQLNPKNGRWSVPYSFEETGNQHVKKIIPYSLDKNFLLIITESNLFVFNIITNRISALVLPQDIYDNDIISSVNDGMFDDEGKLWLTTFGYGVFQFHASDNFVFETYTNYAMKTGLNTETDNAKSIFQDHDGNVWFGLSEKGLTRIIDNNLSVFSYDKLLGSNSFTSVANATESIWAGAYGNILNIDSETGKVNRQISSADGLPKDAITALYLHRDSQLWIGTEASGLFFLDLKTNLLYHKDISLDNLENSINCIAGDGRSIWVATGGGLFKMNTIDQNERWYRTIDSYIYSNIEHLFIDSQQRVFISSKGNRINYLNKEMDLNEMPYTQLNNYMIVNTIAEDEKGTIWIATYGNGVIKVQGDSITNYNQSSGLYSDYCYSLYAHGQHVFVGHEGGASKLDIVTNSIDALDESQGILPGTIFNMNAIAEDSSSHVWFGTSKGLLRIKNDKRLITNSTPPQINMLSVKVNDVEVDFSQPIVLSPGEYKLEFNYIGIKHNNPLKVKYKYKLEGYDKDWSEDVEYRTAPYLKTRYGKYEFKLSAFNEHYIGTTYKFPIKIHIKKPFYLKLWFYLVSLVFLVGSVYLIIKYRERNLRRIQTNLMKKLNEKTREIIVKEEIIKERKNTEGELIEAKNKAEESNLLKSALLANLSHEIRTPLNAIVGFSNLLNDPDLDLEERESYAQVITKNSDNLLGLIEDIVDLSQIESKQIVPRMALCNVYNIVNEVYYRNIEKAKEYCGDEVEYKLLPIDKVKETQVNADGVRLEQILDKLIDNALKFTAKGSVELGCEAQNGHIQLFVKDTGIGISSEQMQYIFEAFRRVEGQKEVLYGGAGIGLTIADKLGHLMKMQLTVESEIEKGSTFTLKIPV